MTNEAFEAAFDGKQEQATPEPETPKEPVEKPAPDSAPARDEQGRFAAKTQEPAKAPAPGPEPEPSPAPAAAGAASPEAVKPHQSGHVPIAAHLDERERRQKAERELEDFRARFAKMTQQPQPQPQPIPSIYDDPEGYAQHLRHEQQRTAISTRFEISELMASDKHGAEAVKSAMDWGMERAQQSPAFASEYAAQRHPVDWIVRQHKRDARNRDIPDDDEGYKAYIVREYAKLHGQAPPAAPHGAAIPQHAPQRPPAPEPSLSRAPNAGGGRTAQPVGPTVAFDTAFPT